MTTTEAFEVAQAVIFALGGGAVLVFAFSSWLGKVWADRLMAKETAKYEQEIEHLKAALQQQLDRSSQTYRQKIELYKEVSQPIIDLIIRVEHNEGLPAEHVRDFDKDRLYTTALLAMFAPQSVFDAYNKIIDYIYNSFEGKDQYSFLRFRELGLEFLSEVRKDIGIYTDSVSYRGNR